MCVPVKKVFILGYGSPSAYWHFTKVLYGNLSWLVILTFLVTFLQIVFQHQITLFFLICLENSFELLCDKI